MRPKVTKFGGHKKQDKSMSDLVLLNALINRVLRDTYALPVYQEQALLLKDVPNANMMGIFNKLAPKGHFIGRTMMAVEAIEIIATPRYVSYEDHAILPQQRLLPERGK